MSEQENKDKLFDLPENWAWTTTSEACSSVRDGTHDTPKYVEQGIPLITSKNLNKDQLDFFTAKFISFEDHKQISIRSRVEKGDVLFAMIGTIGNPIVVETTCDFSIKNIGLFKKNESVISSKYLKYWLSSYSFERILDKQALVKGTTQKFVPLGNIRVLPIPLPPLNEQHRIVTKIKALMARSRRVKEALEVIPSLLNQFRQSVLAAAFRGDLTADWREKNPDVTPVKELLKGSEQEDLSVLPFTWDLASVGDIIESLKYGTSQKCSYDTVGVPVLRIPNIGDGNINYSDLKYADLPDKEFKELRLSPGDILIIRSNGSVSLVGKSAVVSESEKDFAYAGYLIRLRLNRFLIDSIYFNFCFTSYNIRLQIEIPAKSTSGVHNINSQEVKRLRIPIAPLKEQQEIVWRIQSFFKAVDRIEQQYQEARAHLDQLDQSILAKAFRGELVPQDPNDEPASVLLERIRAERAKREAEAKAAKKSTGKTTGQRDRKAKQQDLETIQLGLPGLG